jgi:hypothetical protein
VLYNFTGIDGNGPTGNVVMDNNGVLYGTTTYGGTGFCPGGANPSCGTIFTAAMGRTLPQT